jgi:hypothetical protein
MIFSIFLPLHWHNIGDGGICARLPRSRCYSIFYATSHLNTLNTEPHEKKLSRCLGPLFHRKKLLDGKSIPGRREEKLREWSNLRATGGVYESKEQVERVQQTRLRPYQRQ